MRADFSGLCLKRRPTVGFVAAIFASSSARSVLGLDGTHIKAKYRGVLLAATALDANGSLHPLLLMQKTMKTGYGSSVCFTMSLKNMHRHYLLLKL